MPDSEDIHPAIAARRQEVLAAQQDPMAMALAEYIDADRSSTPCPEFPEENGNH